MRFFNGVYKDAAIVYHCVGCSLNIVACFCASLFWQALLFFASAGFSVSIIATPLRVEKTFTKKISRIAKCSRDL